MTGCGAGGDSDGGSDDDDDDDAPWEPDPVHALPITDELDLHTFAPREVADLVATYLTEAQAAGLAEVRVVHGKGTGTLRRVVHGALSRHAAVRDYALAPAERGGWGATVVRLHPASQRPP